MLSKYGALQYVAMTPDATSSSGGDYRYDRH
jgi:hypothetical protein